MGEFNITAVCTVTDPAERRRRWRQVFRVLMEGSQERKAAEEKQRRKGTEPQTDKPSTASEE